MTWFGALLLAAVAGITEILPVSGTGHLYIVEKALGLELSAADFTAYRGALHLGIAAALLLFYHRQAGQMLRELLVLFGVLRPTSRQRGVPFPRRLFLLLVLSSLPMFAGLALNRFRLQIEGHDLLLIFVGGFLLLSGVLLYFTGRSARETKALQDVTLGDGLLAGLFQIPSVFPGLSRTGLLLSAGLLRGLRYEAAVEFAGLLGIPAFLASGLWQRVEAGKLGEVTVTSSQCFAGAAAAAIIALFTLRFFRERAEYRKPTGFAYWCWGAGLLSVILFLFAA